VESVSRQNRDPEAWAVSLHAKAMSLRDSGRPDAARAPCMRALSLLEKHAGRRHPDVANVLIELAAIEQDRGAANTASERRSSGFA